VVGWSTVADTIIGNIIMGNNDSQDNVDSSNYLITNFKNIFLRIISYNLFSFHESVQDYKIHMIMEIVTFA
jgi:hypothetical protein